MKYVAVAIVIFVLAFNTTTHAAIFTDLNNGTIYDGGDLIWLKDADCFGVQNWFNANMKSNTLTNGQCGLSDGSKSGDWRQPTKDELWWLALNGWYTLSMSGFSSVQLSTYWSGSVSGINPWTVTLGTPPTSFGLNSTDMNYHVWPVRSGKLTLSPATTNYPETYSGAQSSPVTFTLYNGGVANVTVSAINISGTDASQFSVTTGGATPCSSLTPTLSVGARCTVSVTFKPTIAGTKSAALRVIENDAFSTTLQSSLSGTVPIPLDGVCGTSDKQTLPISPSTGLCTSGTPTAVLGNGPWSWNCNGQYGGINANCSANILTYSIEFISGSNNGTLAGTTTQIVNHGSNATTVTAIPTISYHLANWTGNGGFVTTTANPLTVTNVTSAKTITANFAINNYAINFASGGNGTLTGAANQTVNYGSGATAVIAVPATGYHFVNWTGTGGFVATTTNPLTVTNVTSAKTITANFAIDTFAVDFTSGGNGSLTGAANQTVNYNTSATAVTAVPSVGYHFVNWTGTGGFVTTAANPLTVTNVTSAQTITANFAINTFAVNFASGGNGTLTGTANQTVNYGSNATPVTAVPAVPATGYHFVNWTGTGGFVTTTANPLTVTNVTAAQTITANFTIDPTNAACGSSNGGTFRLAPIANLCSIGTASSVSNTGTWSWSCAGINGGTTANCSAAIDISGPTLVISTLANGAITNNATLNISGTVADTNVVTGLTVNNADVPVTNNSFSYPVTLQAGANTLTVVATDALGNITTDTRTITLDLSAPNLIVTSPADNSKTAQSLATVTGTIGETSTVTVKINSGTPQSAAITGNAYSATVNLAGGINTIIITATDLANNAASAARTVTYDNTNPSLAITSPDQDISTVLDSVTISGTVSDTITSAAITITTDGQTYTPTVAHDGSFSHAITLPTDKTYAVVVTATDQAGNSSTAHRNVIKTTPLTQPTFLDALKVLQAVAGRTALTDSEKIHYDVAPFSANSTPQGNGIVDVADIIAILRRSVGIGSW